MSLRSRLVVAVTAVALVALLAADFATYSALRSFLVGRVDQTLQQAAGPTVGAAGADRFPGFGFGFPEGTAAERAAAAGGATAATGATPTTPGTAPAGTGGGASSEFPPLGGREQNRFFEIVFERVSASGHVTDAGRAFYAPNGRAYRPELPTHFSGFSPQSAGDGGPARPTMYFTASSAPPGGPQFEVMAVRLPDGSIVTLATSLADTQSTLQRLALIELIVTIAALAIAGLIGLWLVRVGLRPLDDVEETAERVAAGELDQRVPGEDARTEVGRLARTINTMLTRIEEAFAQRDATEAQLRRSEERLRRFVADASHELRTPLAAVAAYAELFERGANTRPDDLSRVLTGIRSETDRMGHLVDDLLLLARLDEGRPLERRPVDVVEVCDEAVEAARAVGPTWPVTVEVAGPVVVTGDRARLRQVVDNLLANARAHTPSGTAITLRARGVDGDAEVVVADTGPGFAEGDAGRAFERFWRADPARARASGGSGLGLAIVAAIVAAHGGGVAAANGPDGGATVTLRIPLAPGSDAVGTAEGRAADDAVPGAAGTDRELGQVAPVASASGTA